MVAGHLFLSLLASAAPLSTQDQCEAHVFTTDEVTGFTSLGDYGLLTDLFSGGAVPEEALRAQIRVDSQFEISSALMDRPGRLEGFEFVENNSPVAFRTSYRQKQRLTESEQQCYVEIVINYIAFSDTAISKKKVGVHFVTRDFRDNPDKPRILKLGGSAAIAPYIQDGASEGEPPSVDYVAVYTEAFEQAIKRFWRD